MRIGELSRMVGLTPATLRYYERLGLMARPARRGGKRSYDRDAVPHALMLKAARQAGLRIADLKLLAQSANDPVRRAEILKARGAMIDSELERLTATRDLLAQAAMCSCTDVRACSLTK